MERNRRQAPIRIPQFDNPTAISIQNIGDYVGLEEGPTATFVRDVVGSDVVAELRKPDRITSPYASAISARLPEAERLRSAMESIRDENAALLQANSGGLLAPFWRQWRDEANGILTNWSPQTVDTNRVLKFVGDAENRRMLSVRYGVDLASAISAITDIQSLSKSQAQFNTISNANATTLSDADREKLRQQATDKLRAAATQFNREQDQGNVAASAIRTTGQRPLIGRFGTPQTGVGIAARGAL